MKRERWPWHYNENTMQTACSQRTQAEKTGDGSFFGFISPSSSCDRHIVPYRAIRNIVVSKVRRCKIYKKKNKSELKKYILKTLSQNRREIFGLLTNRLYPSNRSLSVPNLSASVLYSPTKYHNLQVFYFCLNKLIRF